MAWVITGIAVGSGVGLLNAAQQRQQKKEELLANAAQIQYSPWTGMKSSVQGYGATPSSAMGALQGGVAGGMMGSQFKNMAATPPTGATPVTDAGFTKPEVGAASVGKPSEYSLMADPSKARSYALGNFKF